jgi:hypothetical protein
MILSAKNGLKFKMKRKIKIAFSDFWGGFEYNPTGKINFDNIFYKILSERFEIEISDKPDFLIFSVFGNNHLNYKCKKIFYTGENQRPNYNLCDYSITFDYLEDKRNFRFPFSGIIMYENNIKKNWNKEIDFDKIFSEKTKFCNFVFSNPAPQSPRNFLFLELSKYKSVDSGGAVYNNLGKLVEPGWDNKLKFMNQYKFTICFENSEYPGYTTEKIIHPKIVNSIPIYWGNPLVANDWNTKSFINAYDFKNIFELIEYIKEVDNNNNLYKQILLEPHFKSENIPQDLDYNNLLDFFDKIF